MTPMNVTICSNCDNKGCTLTDLDICMASPRFWHFDCISGVWTRSYWQCQKINTRGRCPRYESDKYPVQMNWKDKLRRWLWKIDSLAVS